MKSEEDLSMIMSLIREKPVAYQKRFLLIQTECRPRLNIVKGMFALIRSLVD